MPSHRASRLQRTYDTLLVRRASATIRGAAITRTNCPALVDTAAETQPPTIAAVSLFGGGNKRLDGCDRENPVTLLEQ
jgi:hypothetical protein